jgi:hypothetical protein
MLFPLGALAAAVSACSTSGHEFERPATGSLILGVTSPADAVAAFGEPVERWQEPADPKLDVALDSLKPRPAALRHAALRGDFERLRYSFTRATLVLLSDQATARIRLLELAFWQGKLVYYHYSSSFADDATNFDEAKVASFVRGRATASDALNRLGRPGGQAIYPFIAQRGARAYFYQYAIAGPHKGQVTLKHLELLFDISERLELVYLVNEVREGAG